MTNRLVSATEFKANCLALLDEVQRLGGTITVTKRGHPVAVVGPVKKAPWKSPEGAWSGKIEFGHDIANHDTSSLWDVVNPKQER